MRSHPHKLKGTQTISKIQTIDNLVLLQQVYPCTVGFKGGPGLCESRVPLSVGPEFTQPRAHLIAQLCRGRREARSLVTCASNGRTLARRRFLAVSLSLSLSLSQFCLFKEFPIELPLRRYFCYIQTNGTSAALARCKGTEQNLC